MIADEIDGAGAEKAKMITRRAYEWLVWGACAAIYLVMTTLFSTVLIRFHINSSHVLIFLLPGIYPLARFAVNAELRRRGLRWGGRSVEVWTRAGVDPAEGEPEGDPVEVRSAREDEILLSVLGFMGFVPALALTITVAIGLLWGPPLSAGRWSPVSLLVGASIVTLAAGLVGVWSLRGWDGGRPRYRADSTGIAGPRGKPLILWGAVASYRVTTRSDPFGQPLAVVHELLGSDGKTLIRLRLDGIESGDKDLLPRFLADRFPKPVKFDLDG